MRLRPKSNIYEALVYLKASELRLLLVCRSRHGGPTMA